MVTSSFAKIHTTYHTTAN